MLLDEITNLVNTHYSLQHYSKEPSAAKELFPKHLVPSQMELVLESDNEEPYMLFLKHCTSLALSLSPYTNDIDNESLLILTEPYNTLRNESSNKSRLWSMDTSGTRLYVPVPKKKLSKYKEK